MKLLKEEWNVKVKSFDGIDWEWFAFTIFSACALIATFILIGYEISKIPARPDYKCYAGYMFSNPSDFRQTPIQIFGEDGKPLKCPEQENN